MQLNCIIIIYIFDSVVGSYLLVVQILHCFLHNICLRMCIIHSLTHIIHHDCVCVCVCVQCNVMLYFMYNQANKANNGNYVHFFKILHLLYYQVLHCQHICLMDIRLKAARGYSNNLHAIQCNKSINYILRLGLKLCVYVDE